MVATAQVMLALIKGVVDVGVVFPLKHILKSWQLCLSFKLDVLTKYSPRTERNIDHELLSASLILLYMYLTTIILEKWFPLKSKRGHSLYFSSSLALLSSLLSCSFYLLDQRTISGVEILKMTGMTAQSYSVLTTATFQAYRRLTVKCVRSTNVPI